MFISVEQLRDRMGVDEEIARFFVDRKLPEGNLYWKKRYLYIASGTGYLFIPLLFDLQYRAGMSKTLLLDEEYVKACEAILHSAAGYEFEEISFEEHISNCKRIVSGKIMNDEFYQDLARYFEHELLQPYKYLGLPIAALNRADSFLFAFCLLHADHDLLLKMVELWYALVPSFLLMDDIMDLKEDLQNQQENSVSDFGEGSEAVKKAIEFLREKFSRLKSLNPKLAAYFELSLENKLKTAQLQSIIK